ncbi:MAG: beta-ketoacyl-[acyl-carrier-protein] synthase family protein [Solirubrobacteraceae bacterium]
MTVVITGIGAVTPVGADAESTWQALKAGRSGVQRIDYYDVSSFPVQIAGICSDFDAERQLPDAESVAYLHRGERFAVAAAAEALAGANVEPGTYDAGDVGVVIGGSVARPELQEFSDAFAVRQASDGREIHRFPPTKVLKDSQNTAAWQIARLAGAEGAVIGVSTACTASSHALGEAFRMLQDGDAEMIVAGGFDALTSWCDLLGFSLLSALTGEYNDDPERASRPFDRDRSGFVLGEGSVMMVLEDRDAAVARGATILAELVGYSSSLNAYRMTDPPPDGGGAVIAMNAALREAGLTPGDVDYVVAHATSTPAGDISETNAIRRVFGEDISGVVVTSPKSMIGHTTCAASAVNLLAGIYAMRDGVVSPTINVDNQDPECDLDCVANVAREMEVNVVLVNGFAFGGTNGALVARKFVA